MSISLFNSVRMKRRKANEVTNVDIVNGKLFFRRYDNSLLDAGYTSGTPDTGPFSPSTTGAVAPVRYRGGTVSGPPLTGTFVVGDWVVAQNGIVWVCTNAGTPGTWKDASSSGQELERATATSQQVGITTEVDIVGLTLPTFVVGERPVEVILHIPSIGHTVSGTTVTVKLTDAANVMLDSSAQASYKAKAANDYGPVMIRHEFPAGTGLVNVKARALSSGGTSQGFIVPSGITERRTLTAIAR